MKRNHIIIIITTAILSLIAVNQSDGQCPSREYFFSPETELPWAECFVYHAGGSKTRIPFLPAIFNNQSPFGTKCFTKDLSLDLNLVFLGDGKVLPDYDPYKNADVTGKAVLLCTAFPDTINKKVKDKTGTSDCINQAIRHGAAAVIIADFNEIPGSYKFSAEYIDSEIPMIVIDKSGLNRILQSAGINADAMYKQWKLTGNISSRELICKIKIDMKGRFNLLDKSNFIFYYSRTGFNPEDIQALSDINDRAVDFLLQLFSGMELKWKKTMTVYFPGYDMKNFYTLHCGRGLANDMGVFLVLENPKPEYSLIVHENAHKLFSDNMGYNTSFISEGIGMYAQAEATNKSANHITTINFLRQKKLYPLETMMSFNIGRIPEETSVGYPASGSFIGFLIEKYGMELFKKLYSHDLSTDENITARWKNVYGKNINELESEWHRWLLSLTFPQSI